MHLRYIADKSQDYLLIGSIYYSQNVSIILNDKYQVQDIHYKHIIYNEK